MSCNDVEDRGWASAPSAATLRRQLDNDEHGTCRVCGATKDLICDEVAHDIASGKRKRGKPALNVLDLIAELLDAHGIERVIVRGKDDEGNLYEIDSTRSKP